MDLLEYLNKLEAEVLQALEVDHQIKCDNYENVARYKLIQKIKKALHKVNLPVFSTSTPQK